MLLFLLLGLNGISLLAQINSDHAFKKLLQAFTENYQKLDIPTLRIAYQENFKAIPSSSTLKKTKAFFKNWEKQIQRIVPEALSADNQLLFEQLKFEIDLHLERVTLEQEFCDKYPNHKVSNEGIYYQPYGKAWYRLYLKQWLSVDTSPEDLMAFGEKEIKKVHTAMQIIREKEGFGDNTKGFFRLLNDRERFMVTSEAEVKRIFQEKKTILYKGIQQQFLDYRIPDFQMARANNPNMGQVPGYYSQGTFYYNIFNGAFNRRKFDWILLHEAIPGHHFQINIAYTLNRPKFQQQFNYPAYVEGWAAYIEEIGEEVGLYQNNFDWYGKWEWDLVRSVRVVLDIGLNYYGWSNEKALAYWKAKIPNQDDIAQREIDRMRRWPVQVLTYKVGAAKILELKQRLMMEQGEAFNVKQFHNQILKAGPVPLAVLEKVVR